jgi:hypothetical protein
MALYSNQMRITKKFRPGKNATQWLSLGFLMP